jgi:hypothetical protein
MSFEFYEVHGRCLEKYKMEILQHLGTSMGVSLDLI